MSNKTYLLLNNKLMELFLINCGLLDIRNDKNDSYDVLFCDSLELYNNNKINANKKVYLACWLLESLDDISNYKDFQYYIGFGKDFYDKLQQNVEFKCSKILDGFIYNENESKDKYKSDIFIIGSYNNEVALLAIVKYIEIIVLLQKLNLISNNIVIKSNLSHIVDESGIINFFPELRNIYENIEFMNINIGDVSNEYLINTKSIYSLDPTIATLYYCNEILKKCVFITKNLYKIYKEYDININIFKNPLLIKINSGQILRNLYNKDKTCDSLFDITRKQYFSDLNSIKSINYDIINMIFSSIKNYMFVTRNCNECFIYYIGKIINS